MKFKILLIPSWEKLSLKPKGNGLLRFGDYWAGGEKHSTPNIRRPHRRNAPIFSS